MYLDTFAKVFSRTRPLFTDASDEKNWLVSICVSGYREMLRYRKRRELLPVFLRDSPSIPGRAPDQSIRPLSELLQDEKEQQLMGRVCRLPEKYRLPLLLFYFLDKQASVVASVLHISQRAVLARLHQGSAILADQRLDETLHSSLQWHEAEKQTVDDAGLELLRAYQRVDVGATGKSGLAQKSQFAFLTLLLAQDRILDQMGQRLRLELLKSVVLQADLFGNPVQDFHTLYVASHGVLVGKILLQNTPEFAAELMSQYPKWKNLIETGQFMTVSPEEWKEILHLFDPVASPALRGNENPEELLLTRLDFERLLEQENMLPMLDLRPSNWVLLGVRPISYLFEKRSGVTLTLFVCSSKEQQEELYDKYALTTAMTDRLYPQRYYGVKNLFIFFSDSYPNDVYNMSRLESVVIRIAVNG